MRAIRYRRYGPPEVLRLEEAPEPSAGPGQLLVRVKAAALNPIDCKIRAGKMRLLVRPAMPHVPCGDFAGIVEALGPGASGFAVGDEVYGVAPPARAGSAAELLAIDAGLAARKPRSLSFQEAAAVPLAALTAYQGLFDDAGLAAGQRALIHAAAGGVGHFALQLARWKGAHAIGTGSARNEEFARSLGAREYVDYAKARFEDALSPVDVVLDSLAGDVERRSWRVLRRGGTQVSLLDPFCRLKGALRLKRGRFRLLRSNRAQLETLAALVDAGHLKPALARVYPLEEAARAMAELERGHVRGKLVLAVGS